MIPSPRFKVPLASGELDAHYSVESVRGKPTVVLESQGAGRNRHYSRALLVIMQRLGAAGAVVTRVALASRDTKALSLAARTCKVPNFSYPIELERADLETFCKALQRSQIPIGKQPNTGGGNSTRRIQIFLEAGVGSVADVLELITAGVAAHGPSQPPGGNKRTRPKRKPRRLSRTPPKPSKQQLERSTPEERAALLDKAKLDHHRLLLRTEKILRHLGWKDLQEIANAIDLWGRRPDKRRVIFEAKTITSRNELQQTRHAIAQLLEYRVVYGSESDLLCVLVNRLLTPDRVALLAELGIGVLAIVKGGLVRQGQLARAIV